MAKYFKDNIRKEYADILRKHCAENKPNFWTDDIGAFPPNVTSFRNYMLFLLLRKDTCTILLDAIDNFYGISSELNKNAKVEIVREHNANKTVENFFSGTNSKSDLLNFIALVFNFPLQFEAFVEEKLKTPLEQERINHEKFLSNREIPDTSAENRENIADRIQTEFVLPQKSAKNNNTFLSFTLVFLLLLILPASFLFFKMYFRYINAETKITEIENLAFYPKEVGKDVVEVDFVSMKKADNKKAQENPTQKAQDEISLSFFTNNIFNKSFIYTQNTWDFETDKRGEDMNSEYGAPYNEEIRHLKPDKITAPTLANQQIWIRFNIKNNGKTKIFVDNIALKILNRYDLKEDEVSYDVWFPKSLDEKAVEITLNNFAATYPLSTHTELDANESRFFSLKVFGDESLKKRLIKFRLIVSCTDGAGSRQTIHSDKDYFVGFLPPL